MSSYILRNPDPELWERVKARSVDEGIPLRAIILALLELYAAGKINVKASITASRVGLVLLCVLLAGCHGLQETPGLLGPTPVVGPPPQPTPLPPQPSTPFTIALEIVKPLPTSATLLTWQALVTVTVTPGIVSPALPASVEVDCGTGRPALRHEGFYGTDSFSCIATAEGTYETRATARAASSFSAQAAERVTVAANLPAVSAALNVDNIGPVETVGSSSGRRVTFTAFLFPTGRLAMGYEFDFGDGVRTPAINSQSTEHIYTNAGTYTAKVSIKTTDGRTASDNKRVEITF
jgi:hypothetical protein